MSQPVHPIGDLSPETVHSCEGRHRAANRRVVLMSVVAAALLAGAVAFWRHEVSHASTPGYQGLDPGCGLAASITAVGATTPEDQTMVLATGRAGSPITVHAVYHPVRAVSVQRAELVIGEPAARLGAGPSDEIPNGLPITAHSEIARGGSLPVHPVAGAMVSLTFSAPSQGSYAVVENLVFTDVAPCATGQTYVYSQIGIVRIR